jgi:hypothetical protein
MKARSLPRTHKAIQSEPNRKPLIGLAATAVIFTGLAASAVRSAEQDAPSFRRETVSAFSNFQYHWRFLLNNPFFRSLGCTIEHVLPATSQEKVELVPVASCQELIRSLQYRDLDYALIDEPLAQPLIANRTFQIVDH